MNLEITNEKATPLLSRIRVKAVVTSDKETPSRQSIRDKVADMKNVDKDLVVIKHIYPQFGKTKAKVIAHIYSNKDDVSRFEDEHIIERHTGKKVKEAK
jgi:ribosomal protein S24E